jgi:hypothetical protein
VIEIHGENGKIGEVSLKGGKVAGSTPAVQDVVGHMLRKHGSPQKAFRAMAAMNNGYVWAENSAIPKRLHAMANDDSEAIEMATATPRKMPMVRGAADVQLRRTGPGMITVQHKSTGMKVGTITPKGAGWQGMHATGTMTGASGSQQGALTGLIAFHNKQAAKAKASGFPPAQQDGTAVMPGSKTYTAAEQDAVDLAGALPVSTPASSSSDGPRVTSMGSGKTAAAPSGNPSGLSPYALAIYRKFIAKKMKPAVALAFAKRADAMHAKAA